MAIMRFTAVQISVKMLFGLPPRESDTCLEAAMVFALSWAFEASLPPKARAFFNILVGGSRSGSRSTSNISRDC